MPMPYDEDKNMSPEHGSENREETYDFLREKIKPKQISRQKILQQVIRLAFCGMIVGMFACLGFFALKPWAQKWFRGNPNTVTIPEDKEAEEESGENEEIQTAEPVLDSQSYEQMMESMDLIAKEAQKFVVSVSRVSAEADWKSQASGITDSVTGVITADNGQDLLILSDVSVCSDAQEWQVTFSDGSCYPASIKKKDLNTGFAVFGVAKSLISSSTWNNTSVAVLGNSNLTKQGDMVIALGSLFGYPAGMAYGTISSCEYKTTFFDAECTVLATDIPVSDSGTGVLVNTAGEVVGIVSSDIWKDSGSNAANAYAISDLKAVIQLLLNGKSVPYIGISGTKVTEEIRESQGIPQGLYVMEVDPDSPAMAAGIQSGDVICEVEGEEISTLTMFRNAVLNTAVGTQIKIVGKRQGADGYVDIEFRVNVGSLED